MAQMTIRSTYALDTATAERIKRLARVWGVSQAEVIRRSVQLAAEQEGGLPQSPADVLAYYANAPLPRDATATDAAIAAARRVRREADQARAHRRR